MLDFSFAPPQQAPQATVHMAVEGGGSLLKPLFIPRPGVPHGLEDGSPVLLELVDHHGDKALEHLLRTTDEPLGNRAVEGIETRIQKIDVGQMEQGALAMESGIEAAHGNPCPASHLVHPDLRIGPLVEKLSGGSGQSHLASPTAPLDGGFPPGRGALGHYCLRHTCLYETESDSVSKTGETLHTSEQLQGEDGGRGWIEGKSRASGAILHRETARRREHSGPLGLQAHLAGPGTRFGGGVTENARMASTIPRAAFSGSLRITRRSFALVMNPVSRITPMVIG